MGADSESPQPHQLAAELGRRSGAVVAIVTLRNSGAATMEQLGRACARQGKGRLGEDLSWLAAVGLIRRESAAGTWDIPDPTAVYRLSSLGQALATSLAALAEGCAVSLPHRSAKI
jgi:hypothetical protein